MTCPYVVSKPFMSPANIPAYTLTLIPVAPCDIFPLCRILFTSGIFKLKYITIRFRIQLHIGSIIKYIQSHQFETLTSFYSIVQGRLRKQFRAANLEIWALRELFSEVKFWETQMRSIIISYLLFLFLLDSKLKQTAVNTQVNIKQSLLIYGLQLSLLSEFSFTSAQVTATLVGIQQVAIYCQYSMRKEVQEKLNLHCWHSTVCILLIK